MGDPQRGLELPHSKERATSKAPLFTQLLEGRLLLSLAKESKRRHYNLTANKKKYIL